MTIRRRRHYGFNAFAYVGLTALMALGAVNSQNNLLFFIFGITLAALLISGLVGGAAIMRVRVRREPIGEAQVGEPLRIVYKITNTSRALPAFAITVSERARPRAHADPYNPNAVPAPTWPAHMSDPLAFAPHIPARAAAHATAVVIPTRRGLATFHAFRAETAFPFGIVRKSALFIPDRAQPAATVLIRPRVEPAGSLLLRERLTASQQGEPSPTTVGRGDEFFGLRDYAPGDTLKRIAWKASARTGDLVVRETIAHAPARIWIILAPRSSLAQLDPQAADAEDERAVSLAAGAIIEANRRQVAVGLIAPVAPSPAAAHAQPAPRVDDALIRIPPRLGQAHIGNLLDALALADMTPRPPTDLAPPEPGAAIMVITPRVAPRPAPLSARDSRAARRRSPPAPVGAP